MTEWKRQGETVCMPNTVCCAMAADGEEARMIVARHNADCDTYEARIAELEAELARVKAESLRVVVDGDAMYWDETIVQPVRLERWEDEG